MMVTRADRLRKKTESIRLDIDAGEAVRSPCLGCPKHDAVFPKCIKKCDRIGAFQAHLVGCVSTGKGGSFESCAVPYFTPVTQG